MSAGIKRHVLWPKSKLEGFLRIYEILNKIEVYLMRAPEARAKIFRVFCLKTAYDVIIFKFQGGASAPPCTPLPAPMLSKRYQCVVTVTCETYRSANVANWYLNCGPVVGNCSPETKRLVTESVISIFNCQTQSSYPSSNWAVRAVVFLHPGVWLVS